MKQVTAVSHLGEYVRGQQGRENPLQATGTEDS